MSEPASEPESGMIEYLAEGYLLRWSPGGMEIQVTDHHASRLRLTWEHLCGLAQRAGWLPPAPGGAGHP